MVVGYGYPLPLGGRQFDTQLQEAVCKKNSNRMVRVLESNGFAVIFQIASSAAAAAALRRRRITTAAGNMTSEPGRRAAGS